MRRKKWISVILAVSVLCVNSSVGAAAAQNVNQDGWKIWDEDEVKADVTPMDEKANQWKEIMAERTKAREGADSSDEISESEEENANYQVGLVRAVFMDSSGSVERIKVLTDTESGKIWIDGEDFVGNLNYYNYSYNKSEKTIEITARNKQLGFQTGSSQLAYKIGDNEAFYSMSEPVKKYNHRVWIPADDFFYLIGCKISPLMTTDSGDYIPESDILVIRDPQYTVLDILYDIFSEKNGMGWMFSYEKDFGVDEKTLTDLMAAGRMGTSLYGTATLDLETILSYLTGLLVDAVNKAVDAKSEVTDADFDEIPNFYDKTFVRGFVEKMLSVTGGELEFMAEEEEAEIDGFLSIAEIAAENFGEMVSETEGKGMEQLLDTWSQNTDLWKVFKSDYAEISKSFKILESGSEGFQSMLSLFGVVLTEAGIVQGMMNHDDLLSQAMGLYLKDSKSDNRTPAKIRKLLEKQFAKQKTKAGYFVTESVRQNLMNYITGVLKSNAANLTGKEAMGILGISTGGAKFVWALLESSGLDPLPKVSEAEAVQTAVYGMMYEPDAWRELAVNYLDIAAGNGLNDQDEIKDAAYMAANYLKACYVTCEAGLKSLESAEYAESDSYAAAKTKLRKISMMLSALADDIQLAEEEKDFAGGYGVILKNSRFYDNELTYDMFVNPSTQSDGKDYSYYLGKLDAPSYESKIEPVVIKVDYYQFIRDEVLPERGLASLDTVKKTLTSDDAWQNTGWSQKEGVLGADIADLNQDGIDELLVYILEKKTDDTDGTLLKAELYAVNDNGEIEGMSWLNIAAFSEIEYGRAKVGLMEKDGRVYLYKETDQGSYFADGGRIGYIWCFMSEDNGLKARWSIGQSGLGGESSTACSNSLADFYGPTEGDIQVLSTDGEFHVSPNWVGRPCDIYVLTAYGEYRAARPDEEVLDDSYADNASAIRKGFGILGIDSMAEYNYSDNKYDFENGYGPTLWNTGYMKESCSYESKGDDQGDSSRRNIRVTVSDCTGLREKLDGLAG